MYYHVGVQFIFIHAGLINKIHVGLKIHAGHNHVGLKFHVGHNHINTCWSQVYIHVGSKYTFS